MRALVETALLTHGLVSISNEEMLASWRPKDAELAWVDRGRAVIGTIDEYLPFRARGHEARISSETLERAEAEGASGALTASGTMALCGRMGIKLAVSCGIGGIGDIKGEELCPDLPELARGRAALLAASPKDMLDAAATFEWLRVHGVRTAGAPCTGYIFRRWAFELDDPALPASEDEISRRLERGGLLMLNPIPDELRESDCSILERAIEAGRAAEARGKHFHPAANAEIDRLTSGRSSRAQLETLMRGAELAARMS